MDELNHILREYGTFESDVRVFSSELWFQWCSNCREALESPFLSLLSKNHSAEVSCGTQKAWLNETGFFAPFLKDSIHPA